jgi:uncharacterized protein with GYD domain
MAKFLIKASLTSDGVKGLLKEGGSARKKAVAKMLADLGGKLESFYFAFGCHDVYALGDFPDDASAVASALTINASGLVSVETTVLIEPEVIDKAVKKTVHYRGPGQ